MVVISNVLRQVEKENITIVKNGEIAFTNEQEASTQYIFQALQDPAKYGDDYAFIGSWIVGNTPAGIGMREDKTLGLSSSSRFIPHFIG